MIAGSVTPELEAVLDLHLEGAGALVGMALLHGSRLTVDVFENGPVRIEPIEPKTNA